MAVEKAKENISQTMGQQVAMVWTNWRRAKDYDQKGYDRCMTNWRNYMPIYPEAGLGQWPKEAIPTMFQQGRRLVQQNFIRPIVDDLAGSMVKVPVDPEFIPLNSKITSLTKVVKRAMYSDKEIMAWKNPFYNMILGGLIYAGDIKMIVSDEYHELGNIGFEYCLPGTVFYDPNWKTAQSKDCKVCWKESWLTVDEIVNKYEHMGDNIIAMARALEKDGKLYGENTGATPYATSNDTWGSSFRVIEEYRVMQQIEKMEYIKTEISPDRDIPIPSGDSEKKIQWLNKTIVNEQGNPIWRGEMIYEKEETTKTCVVKTVCPSLSKDKLLEDRKTEIQINCLPFKRWSATMVNGECYSIVDSLIDPQISINMHESMIEYKIKVEGGGGAQWVDKEGFSEQKGNGSFEDFLHNRNQPTKNFITKPGYMERGAVPAKPVQNSTGVPAQVYQHLNHLIDVILPNISKRNKASLGQMDSAGMPAKLYEMLKIQSDNQAYTMHYTWRTTMHEIYEAYLLQAAQTYSNEHIPRSFPVDAGNDEVVLNEPVQLPDGSEGIRNDAAMLKEIRHAVIISETQEGPSERANNVQTLSELISKTPPSKAASMGAIYSRIIANIDAIPEDEKEEIEEISDLETMRDKLQLQIQVENLKKQLEQIQNPQPPQPSPENNQAMAEHAKLAEKHSKKAEQEKALAQPPAPAPSPLTQQAPVPQGGPIIPPANGPQGQEGLTQ